MQHDSGNLAARPDCRAKAASDGAFSAGVPTAPLTDRNGRQIPLRALNGMWSAAEVVGADSLTIRLWVAALGPGLGCRFQPSGPYFVYPYTVRALARLRDARGARQPHTCAPDSPRHRITKMAIYAALKAHDVPPDDVIAMFRRRLGLPPEAQRPPPAVSRDQPLRQSVEARHGAP